MRRTAWITGLGCASIALSSLCGCSWEEIFPPTAPSLPNAIAVDRALRLCSLSEGNQPFHLILDITPPPHAAAYLRGEDMRAQIEIFWLNAKTYRTIIRSHNFSQIRIVNGPVIEEHNAGDFYPRWIENFVDAILNPIPKVSMLRQIPGSVPVSVQSHACISTQPSDVSDETGAQICFQDAEPLIASGVDFTRSVWFDDFAPFGKQKIPRTVVNDLPANVLIHGQVTLLEPLHNSDYALLKAVELTSPDKRIATTLVSKTTAESLLEDAPSPAPGSPSSTFTPQSSTQRISLDTSPAQERISSQSSAPAIVYIRTDRTGKVREAYRDSSDQYRMQDAAVARALTLQFKPLIINGVAHQMEAPLVVRVPAPSDALRSR
jgi:hypothetical protein